MGTPSLSMVPAGDGEEKCPECRSDNFEIGDQYRSREWPDPSVTFYVVLLIPNALIFWS